MAGFHHSRREREELELAQQGIGSAQHLARPLYTICKICDVKGLGLRARRFIPKGSLILEEAPLLSVPGFADQWTEKNTQDVEDIAALCAEFQKLSCSVGYQNQEDSQRRFQVNNFRMSTDPCGSTCTRGIFKDAARINHSCLPNAYFRYDPDLDCLTVYAIYDIEAGGEILINYRGRIDMYDVQTVRRRELSRTYGFICDCRACQPGTAIHNASEARRPIMQSLHDAIIANFGNQDPAVRCKQFEDVENLRNLFQMEGHVYPGLATVYKWEADCYDAELKRPRNETVINPDICYAGALEAGRAKLELDLKCTGPDSEETRSTLAWLVALGG